MNAHHTLKRELVFYDEEDHEDTDIILLLFPLSDILSLFPGHMEPRSESFIANSAEVGTKTSTKLVPSVENDGPDGSSSGTDEALNADLGVTQEDLDDREALEAEMAEDPFWYISQRTSTFNIHRRSMSPASPLPYRVRLEMCHRFYTGISMPSDPTKVASGPSSDSPAGLLPSGFQTPHRSRCSSCCGEDQMALASSLPAFQEFSCRPGASPVFASTPSGEVTQPLLSGRAELEGSDQYSLEQAGLGSVMPTFAPFHADSSASPTYPFNISHPSIWAAESDLQDESRDYFPEDSFTVSATGLEDDHRTDRTLTQHRTSTKRRLTHENRVNTPKRCRISAHPNRTV